jgi:hypothetical protein
MPLIANIFGIADNVADEISARAFADYAKGRSNDCPQSSLNGAFLVHC